MIDKIRRFFLLNIFDCTLNNMVGTILTIKERSVKRFQNKDLPLVHDSKQVNSCHRVTLNMQKELKRTRLTNNFKIKLRNIQ